MEKIKKMGKIIYIIAKICRVFVIVGAVGVLIGTIALLALPKGLVTIEGVENQSVSIDFKTVTHDISVIIENKDRIINSIFESTEGAKVEINDEGVLVVENDEERTKVNTRSLGMSLIGLFIYFGCAYTVLFFVGKLAISLKEGRTPFSKENINFLKIIGFCLLGFAIVPGFIGGIINEIWNVGQKFQVSYIYDFNFTTILVGVIFITLIYVFEYGLELQTNADETL